jgi:hypothetical protein
MEPVLTSHQRRGMCHPPPHGEHSSGYAHRAYAAIAQPNAASVALRKRFGFKLVGTFTEQGRKLGRYGDVAGMRTLPSPQSRPRQRVRKARMARRGAELTREQIQESHPWQPMNAGVSRALNVTQSALWTVVDVAELVAHLTHRLAKVCSRERSLMLIIVSSTRGM